MDWDDFGKWYEWKIYQNLEPNQRETVKCIESLNSNFEKVKEFWMKSKIKSKKGSEDINKYIEELKKVKAPKECMKYKSLLIEQSKLIENYCSFRSETEDRKRLESKILQNEGAIFSSFFQTLNEIGLIKDFDSEVKKLDN